MGLGHYFSIKGTNGTTQLYFLEEPISNSNLLPEAKQVLRSHCAPDLSEQNVVKALIFAIASQSMVYERAVDLLTRLRTTSPEQLEQEGLVYSLAQPSSRFPEDRFSPAINFAANYSGGIGQLVQDYFANPAETRGKLVKEVKWLAHKTASFWYLCLGGTQLMTLDIHNIRQIAGLAEIEIDRKFYSGASRRGGKTRGKKIVNALTPAEYLRLERETLLLLGHIPALQDASGQPNGALITTLFWWAGAKGRRENLRQLVLPTMSITSFTSPYR